MTIQIRPGAIKFRTEAFAPHVASIGGSGLPLKQLRQLGDVRVFDADHAPIFKVLSWQLGRGSFVVLRLTTFSQDGSGWDAGLGGASVKWAKAQQRFAVLRHGSLGARSWGLPGWPLTALS